ncbi:MAG: transcription initiation factor subunit alpha [Archaeoglobaceae archaeon]|nr:transcription initiation factor subunit alpha [Archaeoglobaceae archaeon]MDK2875742.1 transcription initiation factor subunit alpha [Archaeoglobaceae archaeon]
MKVLAKEEELIGELISRVAGEIGAILYSLGIKGEFTDDQLALELGIEINEIRKALFAMYELGLAEYRRKKDDETGWMEYYWKLNYEKSRLILKRELEKTKEKLLKKLEAERNAIYYICPNMCIKVSYDEAISMNFVCPRCQSSLQFLDCSSAIAKIEEEIKNIDEILSGL